MKTRLTQFLWKWAFAIAGLCAGLFIFAKIDGFLDQAKLDFLSFPCLKVEDGRHHSMLPGCSGVLFDNGRTISFTINEDGMRDQPRKRILEQKKRVFVLGDSQVFGSRMEYSQTISSLLREKFPEWYFINGGLPFSGSLFQAKSFADSYKIYQPEKILWIVDEFFPQQDRMACALLRDPKASAEQMHFQALDLGRVPDFFLSFGDKNILLEAARGVLQRRREQEMLRSKNADRCNKCEGFLAISKWKKKHGSNILALLLERGEGDRQEASHSNSTELSACLRSSGIPFFSFDRYKLFPGLDRKTFAREPMESGELLAFIEASKPVLKRWLTEE